MKFRNLAIKYQSPMSQDGGNGQPATAVVLATATPPDTFAQSVPAVPAVPAVPPAPDNTEFNEFLAWKSSRALAQAQAQAPAPALPAVPAVELSAYEKMLADQTNAHNQVENNAEIRKNVEFDLGFNEVIAKSKSMFSFTAEDIRASAKGLEGKELVHTLKCTAVKDFFSNAKNLALLTPQDSNYILDSVARTHDNNVDSSQAWAILERAVHVSNRMNSNQDYRNNGGGGNASDTPNISNYINKIINKKEV